MSAYIVFIREKTLDKSELETYWQKAPEAMEGIRLSLWPRMVLM